MKRLALFALGAVAVWVCWDSITAWWAEFTEETYDPHWFDTLPDDEFWRRVNRHGSFH